MTKKLEVGKEVEIKIVHLFDLLPAIASSDLCEDGADRFGTVACLSVVSFST